MSLRDFSDRDMRLIDETVSKVAVPAKKQPVGDTRYVENDFSRLFMTPPDGIPARTRNLNEIQAGKAECAPLFIDESNQDTITDTEDPSEFDIWVYNVTDKAVDGDKIVTAKYDPFGFWIVDSSTGTVFPVDLVQVGGANGSGAGPATYTYDVYAEDGQGAGEDPLATNIDPANGPHLMRRHIGRMQEASKGLAHYNRENGILELDWINEWIETKQCEPPPIGTMFMSTPGVAGNSLGAGWDTLDYFDTAEGSASLNLNPVTGEFTLDAGWWDLGLGLNLAHNESNQGRETIVRMYNVTQNTPAGPGEPLFIGRNQPGTNFYSQFRAQVLVDGETYRVEIGGGDSLTAVVWNSLDLNPTMIG